VSRAAAFGALLRAAAPELAERLRAGQRRSPVTGMLRMPNIARRAYGPGWALVGDAGYHRDAVTGYGISDAYRDADLLACAVHRILRGQAAEAEALADYQHRRDRARRPVFELTVQLSAYPAVPRFVELQKQLSRAIDVEATELSARPFAGRPALVTA
jgi:flavin-dependent dehydrogenase